MLLTEWNDDEYREVIREEAIAEGRAEGIAEGRAEGRTEGRTEGIAEGIEQGIERGRANGIAEVARGMKTKGFSGADIADITGLSEEAIAALY